MHILHLIASAAGKALDRAGLGDTLRALAGYRQEPVSGLGMRGHLRVWRADGTLMFEGKNKVVYAGLEDIVDKLQGAGDINGYKYIGFGLGVAATTDSDTQLGSEITGGTYARLSATQGEGDNAREYRLSGTWTNTSGATRDVTEYAAFDAPTGGTMFCRISTGDDSPPATKTVAENETITIQWDIQLQDA
jgi:hypothetical protein